MEPRVTKDNLRVYLTIKKADERSHLEDTMVLVGLRWLNYIDSLYELKPSRP